MWCKRGRAGSVGPTPCPAHNGRLVGGGTGNGFSFHGPSIRNTGFSEGRRGPAHLRRGNRQGNFSRGSRPRQALRPLVVRGLVARDAGRLGDAPVHLACRPGGFSEEGTTINVGQLRGFVVPGSLGIDIGPNGYLGRRENGT